MERSKIEHEARLVQQEIWRHRESLFPLGVPPPQGMLEPETAAAVLGYQYVYSDGLGNWGQGRDLFEIAGMLDQQRKLIAVSNKYDYPAMRFTGAHEIGHVALGHPDRIMHRDRPVFDISRGSRDPKEQDADYFAACFLAPEKLVRSAFKARFLFTPLRPTDDVVFNLCRESQHALMRAGPGSYGFAAAVAASRTFNGGHFKPLHEVFGISVSAMAIRIQELGLIQE